MTKVHGYNRTHGFTGLHFFGYIVLSFTVRTFLYVQLRFNTLFLFPDWQCFVCIYFYRPQTKLRKGNVFTPVCQSFCSQGGCLPQCILGYTHPPLWADTPPGQTPPTKCMLGYSAQRMLG